MEDESSPLFEDALKRSVERVEERLGSPCSITVHTHLSEAMLAKLEAIDHEKFRQELWYSRTELLEKTRKKGFVCFILSVGHEPVAFLFGYDYDAGSQGFFLDELATRVEGKGVGKVLITLLLVYCYELGYTSVFLYTEDLDQDGRHLRDFYEYVGFSYVATDPALGVVMRYSVEEKTLSALFRQVMFTEGGVFPPYFSNA